MPAPEAYLGAPYFSNIVASKRGDRIAWLVDDRGDHQVWSAAGPDFRPKMVAHWAGDDGRGLGQLTISGDGVRLAFVRGIEEFGRPSNASSDATGLKTEVWTVDAEGQVAPALVGEGMSPVLRPDAASVDFVAKDLLHHASIPAQGGATPGPGGRGDDTVFHALGQISPPVWSPDSARFAFVSKREDHALVGVFEIATRRITWMAPSLDRDSQPSWSPDGKRIAFLRHRGRETPDPVDFYDVVPVSVVVADAASGLGSVVVAEDATGGHAQHRLAGGGLYWARGDRLVFASERDGFIRLYSASALPTGELSPPTPLTPTHCEVMGTSLSPDAAMVVATTNCGDLERLHILAITLPAGTAREVTRGTGIEWAGVATTSGTMAFVTSTALGIPSIAVLTPGATAPRRLGPDRQSRGMPAFVEPQPLAYRAPDGVEVHAELLVPPPAARAARMPALVFVHGGPNREMLAGWDPKLYYHHTYAVNQYLAARGYVILEVNYRLGIGYGRAFRTPEHAGPFGASEYQDVVAGAQLLAHRPDVDPARIGIWGGSYGGYLTALALSRDSSTFHAGVDLAGVHDWARVRKDQTVSADEVRLAHASSPTATLDGWTSPVLVVAGDDDHQVPVSESVDLVQKLRNAGKAHVEVLAFPDETHGYALHAHWLQLAERIPRFFDAQLRSAKPAATQR
jgi:dipeptidyl aminopeptidase/acylaminoacyl peptidase